MQHRILVVEDDPDYAAFLKLILADSGIELVFAGNLIQAKQLLHTQNPDLFLLDDHLPDGSGMEFCRELRRDPRFGKAFVVILTAMRSVSGGDKWLDAEADACWIKSRSGTRIRAMVLALLRRQEWDTMLVRPQLQGITLDPVLREVHFKGQKSAPLSRREYLFMSLLLNAYPNPLPRETIYEQLYPHRGAEEPALDLNSLLKRLRGKLPKSLAKDIQAARDRGYYLVSSGKP